MKHHFLILFFLIAHFELFAQVDDEFWFAVPDASSLIGEAPIFLNVQAGENGANVSIRVPANPQIAPINVTLAANDIEAVSLSFLLDSLENNIANVVTNKGLLIESNQPIRAYYELLGLNVNQNVRNAEIFTLKGRHALGTEFYTPFQDIYANGGTVGIIDAFSSIDVVATEDSTVIHVEPTNSVIGHGTSTFSQLLNSGQTFSIRATGQSATDHLGGTHVTSNKPIAITLKDDAVGSNGYDGGGNYKELGIIGDQIVPVNEVGNEYIIPGSGAFEIARKVFMVSTNNNNNVYHNGALIATVNRGESYKYVIPPDGSSYFQSDFPIYVFVESKYGDEYGGALLAHLNCTGDHEFSILRNSQEVMHLAIVVQSGGEGDFNTSLGNIITADRFEDVIGSNDWKYADVTFLQSDLPTGQTLTITNTDYKFLITMDQGERTVASLSNETAVFASYGSLNFGISKRVCDETILDAGFNRDSYLWSTGDTVQSIAIDSTGEYWVTVTDNGCQASDTVLIDVRPGSFVSLRTDTSLCENDTLTLSANTDTLNYLWSTGETTPSISFSGEGTIWIRGTNQHGCSDYDSVDIEGLKLPVFNFVRDTIVCGESVSFQIDPSYSKPIWRDFDNNVLSTAQAFEFRTTTNTQVSATNVCGTTTDSVQIEFREHEIPNVFTPNNDSMNDDFSIIDFGSGDWYFAVYNRYGKEVYQEENFDGVWRNVSLPDATYYYILSDQTCIVDYKGWLQIVK